MRYVLHLVGLQHAGSDTLIFIAALAFGVFLIVSWMTDMLMERLSFGIILNMILLMIGAVLGLIALGYFGMSPTRKDYLFAVFACLVSAVVVLLIPASLKRAV